ncbi:phosphatidylinositol 4-kinase alpha 1 [Dorcoceras hygrometricum]|uniref:Phosphatidylinositol 4-kinase alpha 1 n=1 Tax=Dorcoceras hygrometricum TaxID=472368 RepID=A0A2Z7CRL6_9LAMI|nr:phosphatidylinositol 4-kinase alpha 1 [Dorcoceras hygrometricum]
MPEQNLEDSSHRNIAGRHAGRRPHSGCRLQRIACGRLPNAIAPSAAHVAPNVTQLSRVQQPPSATMLRNQRLTPTSFTRKSALRTVGGGRSSIRSTTGINTPSLACTRRPAEFSTDENTSARWSEQVRRRGGGGGGVRLGKSNSLKSSSCAQHIELRFRAGIMIQYLCDPQWFRDTASRGPTTIVTPKSQFRTCPTDHDSIGYPCMKASGESSTTKHRLLHASGPHPIPPPNDHNVAAKATGTDTVMGAADIVVTEALSLAKDVATMTESEDTGSVSNAMELNVSTTSDEESMSLEDILTQIPAEEAHNDNDVPSIAQKAVRAKNAILTTDLADVRQEVKDLKDEFSKDFDDKLAVIRNDLLEFRVETQGRLTSRGTNLAELIAFITKGSADKRGEVSSSHGRGQPPPDNQSRRSGGSASRSGGDCSSRRRDDRRGSSTKRGSSSGGGGSGTVGGPYKKNAECWLYGNNQF